MLDHFCGHARSQSTPHDVGPMLIPLGGFNSASQRLAGGGNGGDGYGFAFLIFFLHFNPPIFLSLSMKPTEFSKIP